MPFRCWNRNKLSLIRLRLRQHSLMWGDSTFTIRFILRLHSRRHKKWLSKSFFSGNWKGEKGLISHNYSLGFCYSTSAFVLLCNLEETINLPENDSWNLYGLKYQLLLYLGLRASKNKIKSVERGEVYFGTKPDKMFFSLCWLLYVPSLKFCSLHFQFKRLFNPLNCFRMQRWR